MEEEIVSTGIDLAVNEAPVKAINDLGDASSVAVVTEQINGGVAGVVSKNKFGNDNLRDIGTWSNEQAANEKNGAVQGSAVAGGATTVAAVVAGTGARQPAVNNTRTYSKLVQQSTAAPVQPAVGRTKNSNEEWEEEWQGDLSQTQIFTASSQKKEGPPGGANNTSSASAGVNDQNDAARFSSNFPIGHFNAEEATQKIKKAVGGSPLTCFYLFSPLHFLSTNLNPSISLQQIGNVNTVVNKQQQPAVSNTTAPGPAQTSVQQHSVAAAADHHASAKPVQPAKPSITKISSVKPPPPSTKIPKSAVVMPDGTSNSTNFSLDVQFGCDFDTISE